MDTERWQRVREVFHAAAELDRGRRDPFLDEACAGDGELRREVESLLASADEAEGFLEGAPAAAGIAWDDADPEGPDPFAGRLIGHYRVLHRIGRGGMGVVYLAVRADDEYRKQVALKLLKPGMDSEEIVRRFRTERQILAGLDHPNIARLLDGGTTAEGLPYFVMEYVEGRPILDFCAEQRLTTAERIELFRRVCEAVQFAHQNLVVHRDLKPSNVLVTAGGAPKLLDFGIAKLLNPELAGAGLAATAASARPMTPDYASPEQVRGDRITTASDVYSLGVMLYELLAGRHPHREADGSRAELERSVLEREPLRPSVAAGLSEGGRGGRERRRRRLAGDLDQIVLKALRKEAWHRYASAEQLSEDLRRHLVGLPVVARRGTVAYRVGKFVQRHRWGVAAAAALAAAVLGFGVVMGWQRAEIAQQRDAAERQRARAEQVTAFLVDLFEASDPLAPEGGAVTARELLDAGAARLGEQLGGQPEVQAALMDTVGVIYARLGLYAAARPLLAGALAIRREALGSEHPQVADSFVHLGALDREEGDYAAAERRLLAALELRRRLLGDDHAAVAETLNELGALRQAAGDYQAAEARFREALELRRRLLGADGVDEAAVAESLNDLAAAVYSRGDQERAEGLFRDALALNRRLFGDVHPRVAETLNNLAVLLQRRGESVAAQPFYEEALAVRRRLLGDRHPDVGNSLYNLADLLADRGDFAAAESLAAEALAILEGALPAGDWRTALVRGLHGRCLTGLGRYPEAESLLLESYRVLRAQRGEGHRSTRAVLRRTADLYEAWGRPVEAARYRAELARVEDEGARATTPPSGG